MSERRACQLVNQPRGTQRYRPTQREDEDALTRAIVAQPASMDVRLSPDHGSAEKVRLASGQGPGERIWRREGLKVPQKQKPRGACGFNDGSCVRLRPEHANHVWSYDFVSDRRTMAGRCAMLNLIDEHTGSA